MFSARDFFMRLALLLSGLAAAALVRSVGTRFTLLVCAGLIGLVGALALAWGRRAPELMQPAGGAPAATRLGSRAG